MRYFISVRYFTHILLCIISFSSSSPYSLVILYLKLPFYISFFHKGKFSVCYLMLNTLCGITTATISKSITTTTITTTTTTTSTTTITFTTALYFPYVLSFFFLLLLLPFLLLLLFLLLIFSQFHNSTNIIYLSLLLLQKFSSLVYMYHVLLTFYTVLHFPAFCAYIKVHDMAPAVY